MPVVSLLILVLLFGVGCAALLLRRRSRRRRQTLAARLDELLGGQAAAATPPRLDPLAGRAGSVHRIGGSELASVVDEAIACIRNSLDRSYSPVELAADLNISPRSLERVLAATLECSPSLLILAMKMREARRLLLSGRYQISQVAARLAFPNPQCLTRQLKTFFGTIPPTGSATPDG